MILAQGSGAHVGFEIYRGGWYLTICVSDIRQPQEATQIVEPYKNEVWAYSYYMFRNTCTIWHPKYNETCSYKWIPKKMCEVSDNDDTVRSTWLMSAAEQR